ncbi:MAG: hypothetical protein J7L32_05370 [Thermoplasmata archaeon]|nr:hypothetical protein [Thermoplasmata archaeon]
MSFNPITTIPPEVLENLPRWENGQLKGNVRYKVRAYILANLIEEQPDGSYILYPLPGRSQIHRVQENEIGLMACTCQGYHVNGRCSHTAAVEVYRRIMERTNLEVEA